MIGILHGQRPVRLDLRTLHQEQAWADAQWDHVGITPLTGRHYGLDDLQVAANAIRRHGYSGARHLTGVFALAVVDPAAHCVYLVRDLMGERSLYYSITDDMLTISTDRVALASAIDTTPDDEAVALTIARCYRALRGRTCLHEIAAVPAGSVVRIDAEGTRINEFASVHDLVDSHQGGDIHVWADRLRGAIDISCRSAINQRAAAVHISGGLDSGIVASLGARARTPFLAAYSWSPPRSDEHCADFGDVDERNDVEALCTTLGMRPTFVEYDEAFIREQGQANPCTRPQAAWLHEGWVARDAAQRGVEVILSGWGGDEAASHNGRQRGTELLQRAHLVAALSLHWKRGRTRHRSPVHLLISDLARLLGRDKPLSITTEHHLALSAPDLWREHADTVVDALAQEVTRLRRATTVRQSQIDWLTHGHLAWRNAEWNAGGMGYGVRYRFPLQDPRVLAVALSAPTAYFDSGRWSRLLMRVAANPHLPPQITWRTSKHDPALFAQNARVASAWREAQGLMPTSLGNARADVTELMLAGSDATHHNHVRSARSIAIASKRTERDGS